MISLRKRHSTECKVARDHLSGTLALGTVDHRDPESQQPPDALKTLWKVKIRSATNNLISFWLQIHGLRNIQRHCEMFLV